MCKRNSFLAAVLVAVAGSASAQAAPPGPIQPLPAASQQARETLSELAASARQAEDNAKVSAPGALPATPLPLRGGFGTGPAFPGLSNGLPFAASQSPHLLAIEGAPGAERARIASDGQTFIAGVGTSIGEPAWRVAQIDPAHGLVRICRHEKGGTKATRCRALGFASASTDVLQAGALPRMR